MKVTLLKDWKTRKAGDTFDTTDQRAKQLSDAGVAVAVANSAPIVSQLPPIASDNPPIPLRHQPRRSHYGT